MTIEQGLFRGALVAVLAILATCPDTVLADGTTEQDSNQEARLASVELAARESAKAAADAARAIAEDAEVDLDLRLITLNSSDEAVMATIAAN